MKRVPPHLAWRIRAQMARCEIDSVAELHRRLKAFDPGGINYAQFCRFIDGVPARISARTLLALTIILRCGVGELLVVEPCPFSKSIQ